jgi:thiol:disulfide interchange protein DsbC
MNGQTLPPKTCSNPIAETGNIAATMGISGTPAIITSDGAQLGGYVAPDQLLQELQNLQKKKPATAQ